MQDVLLQGSKVFILDAPLQERILHPAPLTLDNEYVRAMRQVCASIEECR